MTASTRPALDVAFERHGRLLWNLCYRMREVAADADDLVQEKFVRALKHPPADVDADLGSWADSGGGQPDTRSPARAPAPGMAGAVASGTDRDAGRGGLAGIRAAIDRRSLRPALEALTPHQRAVLLLREVFDYSVSDTAAALDLRETNVKVTHHRARRRMAAYDRARRPPTRALQDTTRRT